MALTFCLTTDAPESAAAPCIVVGVFEDHTLTTAAARVDEKSGGAIRRLLDSGDLTGKPGTAMPLFDLPGVAAPRVLVAGLGEPRKFDAAAFHRAANESARALKALPIDSAISYLTDIDVPDRDNAWKLRIAALAADQQAYRYTVTFKPKEAVKTPQLRAIAFAAVSDASSARALAQATAIAAGVRFARELGNLPPNICNPAFIATQARHIADSHPGVTLEVLEREDM
ncbi:MAG: leucyl aminopeptidase, partial [Rhodanobacter sp.]|nr:leucyl aminopeptidase [Rhodanobacter sp.]